MYSSSEVLDHVFGVAFLAEIGEFSRGSQACGGTGTAAVREAEEPGDPSVAVSGVGQYPSRSHLIGRVEPGALDQGEDCPGKLGLPHPGQFLGGEETVKGVGGRVPDVARDDFG